MTSQNRYILTWALKAEHSLDLSSPIDKQVKITLLEGLLEAGWNQSTSVTRSNRMLAEMPQPLWLSPCAQG